MKQVSLLFALLFSLNLSSQTLDRGQLEALTEKEWQSGLRLLNELVSMPNDAVYPEQIAVNIAWCEAAFSKRNWTVDRLETGVSVAPDGWTLSGASATVARDASTVKHGTYSAKLTRVGTDLVLTQSLFATDIGLPYLKTRQLVFGAWVWASVADTARLSIATTVLTAQSIYHSGDSTWQFLSVTINILSTATVCVPYIEVNNTNTSVYVDAVAINYGGVPLPYDTRPVEPANAVGGVGSAGAGKQYVSMVVNGITYKVLHDN
jgi:hypothetical protein